MRVDYDSSFAITDPVAIDRVLGYGHQPRAGMFDRNMIEGMQQSAQDFCAESMNCIFARLKAQRSKAEISRQTKEFAPPWARPRPQIDALAFDRRRGGGCSARVESL